MKEKNTIIYIGGFELPDKNAAAHRVVNNAKILKELGYNVVFFGVDKSLINNEFHKEKNNEFISIASKYPTSIKELIASQFSFKRTKGMIESFENVVAVIAYNMHARPLKCLIKYCKKNNIKVVSDLTEWYQNDFSFHPIRFAKFVDTFKSMRMFQKKVDGQIVISSYLERYYSKKVSNITRIPPLIDINDPIWHQNRDSLSKCVTFVYAGTIGDRDQKDQLKLVIDCFSKISKNNEFRLFIIGVDKEGFLKKYSFELNDERIIFLGRLNHGLCVSYLLNCDYSIFFRPNSRKNNAGFPTKYVESITTGTPVITNNISDIKDYSPPTGSVILDNYSEENIYNTILDKICLGKINKQEINPIFDYHNYVSKLKAFLDKLFNNWF